MNNTTRDRLNWFCWYAIVALIVVGSLVSWAIVRRVPEQRLQVYNATLDPVPLDASVPPARRVEQVAPGTVWVNTRSKIYHYPGYRWFGTTIEGKFCTEVEAQDEGDRAALNERRPIILDASKR